MRKVLSVNKTSTKLVSHNTSLCSKSRKKKKKKSKRGRPVGYKMSEASKLAISISKTGRSQSKKTKAKIKISVTEYYACLRKKGYLVARVIVHKSDKRAVRLLIG